MGRRGPVEREARGELPVTEHQPEDFPRGTGDAGVDAALQRLVTIGDRPVAEHVGEYEAVHRALQYALAALDQG